MLYIVRHGQTNWNVLNKIQGQADIPLDMIGISQAYELKKLVCPLSLDLILTSPLKRAVKTAEIICPTRYFLYYRYSFNRA